MKAVCRFCGGTSLYRAVEVSLDGSRSIEATYKPDGSLDVKEGHTEDGWERDETLLDYECGDCGATGRRLEDLVAREGEGVAGSVCCCGHPLAAHPAQRKFDRKLFTRGRRACTEPCCGCWEFETDPALASVVREAA